MNKPMTAESQMKIIRIACLAAFAIGVVVTIVFFGWWLMKDRIVFGSQKFDQVQWITASVNPDNNCKRGDMAYDLQQHVLAPGITRQQAAVLLGRPTWEDPRQIEYDLGSCLQAQHGLRLFFDENDHLTHSRITQH
jgi:hypothetical protein